MRRLWRPFRNEAHADIVRRAEETISELKTVESMVPRCAGQQQDAAH
jgi:hypothetical protein